ncbi:MAG: NifU family protein [Saprospiraceae bacterium]|jgi:Fe-S cluster biogenesis protein NfuA|nr:NifU family protein [Saprospiraceae bacterium]MDP4999286.1 NifU family protein [Saprospiraceae bacterium]
MAVVDNADLLERIDHALDDIRPHLAIDGGNVEVVEVTSARVLKIKWIGACESCRMSAMTMKAGVEQAVLGKVPEIIAVEAINGVN